jgi:hypothetical protein
VVETTPAPIPPRSIDFGRVRNDYGWRRKHYQAPGVDLVAARHRTEPERSRFNVKRLLVSTDRAVLLSQFTRRSDVSRLTQVDATPGRGKSRLPINEAARMEMGNEDWSFGSRSDHDRTNGWTFGHWPPTVEQAKKSVARQARDEQQKTHAQRAWVLLRGAIDLSQPPLRPSSGRYPQRSSWQPRLKRRSCRPSSSRQSRESARG